MTDWIHQTVTYWQSGGLLLALVAIVSVGIWAYFLRARSVLLQEVEQSREVEKQLTGLPVNCERTYIESLLRTMPGRVAVVIRAALNDMLHGENALAAFSRYEDQTRKIMGRDFQMLATLTAVAPLLGLLGTVMGMIDTFDAVSTAGGETGARVASGISRALITTQFGLVVALPGVFGLARLQRLLKHLDTHMAECRTHTLMILGCRKGEQAA